MADMDQRREPRFTTDQPVVVQVLSDPPARMAARVTNTSGRGLGLLTAAPIPPGAAIRIELDDDLVLGESIYCHTEEGRYLVGVELDQVLVGLTELGKRLEGFMHPAPERISAP